MRARDYYFAFFRGRPSLVHDCPLSKGAYYSIIGKIVKKEDFGKKKRKKNFNQCNGILVFHSIFKLSAPIARLSSTRIKVAQQSFRKGHNLESASKWHRTIYTIK